MPTYSYQCSACNHAFEQVQRMSDDPIKVCPSCGAEAVRRLINSANFILKGSGWYADLYSGGSNKKADGSSGSKVGPTPPVTPGATGGESAPSAPSAPSSDSASSSAPAAPAAPSTPSTSTPKT
jgi:putative FmdB family regulatory protein